LTIVVANSSSCAVSAECCVLLSMSEYLAAYNIYVFISATFVNFGTLLWLNFQPQ